MALTIYPDTNYDSFSTVADATAYLTNNLPASQFADWTALVTDAEKEVFLRQATTLIQKKITLPSTLEDDLKKACIYLANHSIGINMTNKDTDSNVKVDEVVGVVKTEYFAPNQPLNTFPDIVDLLLKDYGAIQSGSFSFTRG
jgi:hypothetical protein